MSSKLFHTGFDIEDYKDILPDINEYLKNDVVINIDKGDIKECIWSVKGSEELGRELTSEEKLTEIRRCFDTGAWIYIKEMIVWIPASYYFFLTQTRTGGARPDFRLNRLKDIYDKIRMRKNSFAIGHFTIKSRQIGETTWEMAKILYEVVKIDYGLIGIQSMTRQVVKQSCWRTLLMLWNSIDGWLRREMYSDFTSGDYTAETLKFERNSDDTSRGKNVQVMYTAGTFDSVNNMRFAILDEWLKWEEQSPYGTFLNYEKFIVNGTTRKGMFSIFSSPADKPTRYLEETYKFWQGCNPDELNEYGTTSTGVFRFYTSPLTGVSGFFDRYGDADPDRIYDWIMARRKKVPKEHLMAEIRAYPLNEKEIFESTDRADQWTNSEGIEERKVYLMGTRKKPDGSPAKIYGNLEWKDGEVDGEVVFRASDKSEFNEFDSRFCFAYLPEYKERLKYGSVWVNTPNGRINVGDRPLPPQLGLVEISLGCDPFEKRYGVSGKNSNAGMVAHKFKDLLGTGINKCPTMIYCVRPSHGDTFHEDCIKAAVFNRAMIQPESINSKLIDYCEDRGYMDWILPKRGFGMKSTRKGDAPSGKGALITDIVSFLDAYTNKPIKEEDGYNLEKVWFLELLDDFSKFDQKDTQKSDLTMAWGQALLGAVKLLKIKARDKSEMTDMIFARLIG